VKLYDLSNVMFSMLKKLLYVKVCKLQSDVQAQGKYSPPRIYGNHVPSFIDYNIK